MTAALTDRSVLEEAQFDQEYAEALISMRNSLKSIAADVLRKPFGDPLTEDAAGHATEAIWKERDRYNPQKAPMWAYIKMVGKSRMIDWARRNKKVQWLHVTDDLNAAEQQAFDPTRAEEPRCRPLLEASLEETRTYVNQLLPLLEPLFGKRRFSFVLRYLLSEEELTATSFIQQFTHQSDSQFRTDLRMFRLYCDVVRAADALSRQPLTGLSDWDLVKLLPPKSPGMPLHRVEVRACLSTRHRRWNDVRFEEIEAVTGYSFNSARQFHTRIARMFHIGHARLAQNVVERPTV